MEFGMFHEFQALPGETAQQSFANDRHDLVQELTQTCRVLCADGEVDGLLAQVPGLKYFLRALVST